MGGWEGERVAGRFRESGPSPSQDAPIYQSEHDVTVQDQGHDIAAVSPTCYGDDWDGMGGGIGDL